MVINVCDDNYYLSKEFSDSGTHSTLQIRTLPDLFMTQVVPKCASFLLPGKHSSMPELKGMLQKPRFLFNVAIKISS